MGRLADVTKQHCQTGVLKNEKHLFFILRHVSLRRCGGLRIEQEKWHCGPSGGSRGSPCSNPRQGFGPSGWK